MHFIIFNTYKSLWYLIHYVYTIFQFIYNISLYISEQLYNIKCNLNNKRSDLENVHNQTKLPNIPKHITILLGDEEPSLKDISKLIIWSMAAGISYISFYDVDGKSKKKEAEIKQEVENNLQHGYNVIWQSNGYKNGFIGKKIHVKMLCSLDGRHNIVETSKEVAKTTKSEDITIEELDAQLKRSYKFPDPQLGIYCGEFLNMNGYPPWQVRLTEFIPMKTHHNITCINFINVLKRYNKCEQRVGK